MDKRLNIIKSTFLFCIAFTVIYGQRGLRNDKDLKATNIEQFHLMVAPQSYSEDGKIKLTIHVMIPSYALQFVKQNGGFESSFEARIALLNEDGQQIEHKAIQETLKAVDYLETISKSNWYFFEHEFLVHPGKYNVVSEVMDIDTRNSGIRDKEIDLTKFNNDFVLFTPQVMIHYKGSWQGGKKLMPSYKNEISFQQPIVPVVISGKVKKGNYSLHMVLKDADDTTIFSLDSTFINTINHFNHQLELTVEEVQGLRVKLFVDLEQDGKKDQQIIELIIKRPGVSSNIRDVDEAVDQMRYILSNEERSKLSKARKKDKENLFYEFWKDRDPTPETSNNELMDQYYGRVRYANEHFTSFTSGWRTDMGMIYILFGPPDDIERIFMSNNRNAHQNWHYYRINRSFIFYDENGFGDYRLTTPYIFGRAW